MADERGPWEDYQSTPATPTAPTTSAQPWDDYTGPPNPQATQHAALSNFFSSLGQVLNQGLNPIPMIQEYVNRPNQMKAAMDVMGTKRGTPEEAAALERGMQVPLSTPGVLSDSPVPMGLEPAATAGYQAFVQKDPAGAAGTLTGAYGALPLAYAGIGKGVGATAGALARGPGTALATQEGRLAVRQAKGPAETLQVIARGPDRPVDLMTRGLKPTAPNLQWSQSAETAMPEVNKSSKALGLPITNIDDLLANLKDAKQRVWGQRRAILGPQAEQGMSLESVADAIDGSVSKRTSMMDEARAKAIRATADKYRGRTFTVQEADELLHDINAELETYYAKNPAARRVAGVNPDTAALNAEATELRKRIYTVLDDKGQGAAPRELSRRYGALMNMEKEIYRRYNVASRQALESLGEQFATPGALKEALEGGGRILRGDILGGGAQIARGIAMRTLASQLNEGNKTNALIERAFRNYNQMPEPIAFDPVRPKALLGSGPIITPPPADPSGITVTTGPPLKPRIAGQLPAPPIVTPPPADPSGMEMINAARKIGRDPKTGRFFVYYTWEGQ